MVIGMGLQIPYMMFCFFSDLQLVFRHNCHMFRGGSTTRIGLIISNRCGFSQPPSPINDMCSKAKCSKDGRNLAADLANLLVTFCLPSGKQTVNLKMIQSKEWFFPRNMDISIVFPLTMVIFPLKWWCSIVFCRFARPYWMLRDGSKLSWLSRGLSVQHWQSITHRIHGYIW